MENQNSPIRDEIGGSTCRRVIVAATAVLGGPLIDVRLNAALSQEDCKMAAHAALEADEQLPRDSPCLAASADWFHSTLLTSVAHDLRTPLTSILGSATTLRAYRRNLNEADQDNLIGLIQAEAERLNRFIANLVDLARLDNGMIEPHLDLVPLDDIIGGALERANLVLASHRVVLDLASDLPMVRLNPMLFEQVVFNLLDNAAKYASSGTDVRLIARHKGGLVRLQVLDEGQGIPPGELERIFDKFYRIRQANPKPAGIGLGLSICRGFVEAMGGTIVAGNRPDRTGSVFTITFRR